MPLHAELQSVRLPEAAKDTAVSYKGTKETKSNRGKIVDMIIKYRGGVPGESWCMDFVYFSYGKAAEALKLINPLYRTGSCSMQLKMANRINSKLEIIPVAGNYFKVKAKTGDIVIFSRGPFIKDKVDNLFPGHTGIVIFQNGDYLILIEGNIDNAVRIKKRYMYSKKFIIVALLRTR